MEELLARYGLTRAEVAKALGISREAVRLWCLPSDDKARAKPRSERPTQRPSTDNAKALNRIFGIPLWELRPDLWAPPDNASAAPEDPPGGDEPHTLAAA